MICPYCGEEKGEEQFTDEHVLPRALGGGLQPTNPFKLRVCHGCNAICGLHVDGPVVRSWLLRLSRAGVRFDVLAPQAPPIPLQFMGRLDEWADETICDYWIGPTGDSIFHFHAPYPGESTMVGGAPGLKPRDLDPGVVFVEVVASNPVWHPIIARSVRDAFDGAPIHVVNGSRAGAHPPYPPVPPELERHLSWVKALPLEREAGISLDLTCGQRFTAKLGLGFGAIFLGAQYQESADAVAIRKYMRSREAAERASLNLRGKALLSAPCDSDKRFVATFGWQKCHTFALLPMGDTLSLVAVLYGAHAMMICLTSEHRLWRDRVSDGGIAWMVSPGTRTFVGPTSVPEMLVDIAQEVPTGPLAALHAQLFVIPEPPPVHL